MADQIIKNPFADPNQASQGGLQDNGEFMPQTVTAATAGDPTTISQGYDPTFTDQYFGVGANTGNQIHNAFNYDTPQAQATQMNLGQVPQSQAQQYGGSSQLNDLLGGQGYDPATLARMHANTTDQLSQQGAAGMSQTKRGLEQAGLQNSPAGAAMRAAQAQQNGVQQNQANNNIEIGNAQLGNSNKLAGVGYQTQIGMSNAQMANQMALENANKLFSALSQNTQNQQQTNMGNAAASQNQKLTGANAEAGNASQFGQAFGNASLQKGQNADTQNAANSMNNNQFNANQQQGANFLNSANQENRYKNAQQIMGGAGFSPFS